ncbi:MAG: FKBP-type peptidyl-prolyl cis-trans isomerase [Treponema sp.]|jgi:FKBP-type peptidyl-prolyl cis-trans isomerase|nr:FKBP-type peptidyl-prolyl cis-trans isomerase [Treponema sp.]
MKKSVILICLFFSVITLHAKAIQEDYAMSDEKARVSYAFGMLFASNLRTTPLEFDYNAFTEGFKAMIEDSELMLTQQEAVEIVETAMFNAMEKAAEANKLREEEFLAANSQRSEVHITPSGLQYEILAETDGEKPASNSVVRVNYEVTLTDGTPVDKSNDSEGAVFPLNMVIPGWTEGLMLMGKGSIFRLYVPSELAYGKEGVQNFIPPNSTLIFIVELLEISDPANKFDPEPEF